jgi:hypothetical protein
MSVSAHYDNLWSFAQIAISISNWCKGLTSNHTHGQWTNVYKNQGAPDWRPLSSLIHFTRAMPRTKSKELLIDAPYHPLYFFCVFATWIRHESEAPVQNRRNQTVRFQEPDTPVSSRSAIVRGTIGLWRGTPPPAKRHLIGGEAWTMTTLEVEAATKRSNRWKRKGN